MARSSAWRAATERRPCPICGHPGGCMYANVGNCPTAVICVRMESPRRAGEAGWLHVLRDDGPTWAPWRSAIPAAIRMMGRFTKDG